MTIYIHPIFLYIAIVPVAVFIWYVFIFTFYGFTQSRWLDDKIKSQNIWDGIRMSINIIICISPFAIVLLTFLMYKIFGLI